MTTIQLPEPCRAGLETLYADMKHAEKLYNAALMGALTAIGLNHLDPHHVNLMTGVIEVADAPKE